MAISNSTQLNDLIGTIVSEEAQSAAYSSRIMRNLVHSVEVPMGAGSITIPRFTALAVAGLTEGVAPNSTTWTTDGVTLSPAERGVYVQISKRALYADPFSDLGPYGVQIGRALASDEDKLILANASGIATTIGSGVFASDAKNSFLQSISYLEGQNAPGPYYGVFSPKAWSSLRATLDDASAYANVGKGIVEGYGDGITNINGYVGSPYGIPCFISSNVQSDAGATTDYNLIFSKEAIGYAWMKEIGVDILDNVVARAFDLMGWYSGSTAELVDLYAVRLDSAK
jgi:hypothetical protein